jgi:hypothetical protein
MAEYSINEVTAEDLQNLEVGWDDSYYDDVDVMLIKSFITNELERKYGQGTHIEVYSLGDILTKMQEVIGEPMSSEDIPFDQIAPLMNRFFGEAVKFFVDDEGNLFMALLVDLLPASSDLMKTLCSFWNNNNNKG